MNHQRALEAALRSLAVRDRTSREMQDFLLRRGGNKEVVDDVLRSLRQEGLLDDASYARRFAEDRRHLDNWGSERIARDLERRGVARELVEEALATHGHDEELALAIALLDRRFPMPLAGDSERDKAWRLLVRRGYAPELAYQAIRCHEKGRSQAA